MQKTPTQRRRKSLDDKEEQSLSLKGGGGGGGTSDAGDSSKKTKKRAGELSKELLWFFCDGFRLFLSSPGRPAMRRVSGEVRQGGGRVNGEVALAAAAANRRRKSR